MCYFMFVLLVFVVVLFGVELGMVVEKICKLFYFVLIFVGCVWMWIGLVCNYLVSWLYQCVDLFVKVMVVFKEWCKVIDFDGIEGWMLVMLMSSQCIVIVCGFELVEMCEVLVVISWLMWCVVLGVVG